MTLEQLSVFNQFGLKPNPAIASGEIPVEADDLPVGPTITAELLSRLCNEGVGRAHFVGTWSIDDADIKRFHCVVDDAIRSPDWLLQLDTWAWAPQSVEELPAARVAFTGDALQGEGPRATTDAVLITSALLLSLNDPRPLLRLLKRFALLGNTCWIIDLDSSAPYWTVNSLHDWLEGHGFLVQSNDFGNGCKAYQCALTPEHYASYLRDAGIDGDMLDVSKLLITTEDADVHSTGGIGTYIKNVRALNVRSGTLLCHLHAVQTQMPVRTVCPHRFVGHITDESFFEGLGLMETAHALLCLLPALESFEFQDYRSIGYRLVQGKSTGRLPQWLHLSVILHGSVDYVKFGIGDETAVNYGIHELKYGIKDAYIFQNADECIAPSKYLAKRLLSEEFGYQLNNLRYVRLPFDRNLLPVGEEGEFRSVKRLIYIGKYNRLKGWEDFLQSVESLAAEGKLANIKEIVSLAPPAPTREHRARLEKFAAYRPLHLAHDELLNFLSTHRYDSLVVIPSRGENYPFVVLEQLLVGTLFVAYDAGGAPEVVDAPAYVSRFFCAPNAGALADRIADILASDPRQYGETIAASHSAALRRQEETNLGWSASRPVVAVHRGSGAPHGVKALLQPEPLVVPAVALAIPVYNTPLEYVSDLFDSVLRSKLKPTRLLLVDDGSTLAYREALRTLAHQKLGESITWILHSQDNIGLAGARNTALELLDEPFIFFLDSDDCLLRHTLQESLIALLLDKRRVAATGFAVYLRAPGSPHVETHALKKADFWMPLGTEKARALALFENQFLTANAMVRADVYRSLGGWDARDRSMWEDWALYSRLAWEGYEFSLVPSAGYLYRTSAGSMSKTYSQYGGRRRLIRNLPFATRLDANVIYSLVNGAGSERSLLAGPALSEREAELIQFIRSLLNKPRLKASILKLYGIYSRLRRKA